MRKEKLHSEKVSDIYTHAYIHTHTHAPTLSHTRHTYICAYTSAPPKK